MTTTPVSKVVPSYFIPNTPLFSVIQNAEKSDDISHHKQYGQTETTRPYTGLQLHSTLSTIKPT